MLQTQVDILLESYKRNVGRRGHILAEIRRVQREVDAIESGVADISSHRLTGMPRSGALSDDTARKAVMLADGDVSQSRTPREIIKRLSNELSRVELDITYVENWLSALNERERHVISSHIIEGNSWQSVASTYAREFGRGACETTLRRLKVTAMDKIYAISA